MEITKPILHVGLLKHELGNISYSESFLKKLAESNGVGIELNDHKGKNIGTVKNLEYKNRTLYATMDIPKEHEAEQIAFSTDIIPKDYVKLDSMTFEPTEGFLNNVVYVNNGNKVRDTETITFLNNLEDEKEGEIDMGDKNTAEELGALRTKYEALEKDFNKLQTEHTQLKEAKTTLETDLQNAKTELETANNDLGVYKQAEEDQKLSIIKKLVKSDDDPLVEVYQKMELKDIQLLMEDKGTGDTPPKGVGTATSDQNDGSNPDKGDDGKDKPYDYQAVKEALELR